MELERKNYTVWLRGFRAIMAIMPQGLYLTLSGMAIPVLFSGLYLDGVFFEKSNNISHLMFSSPVEQPIDFFGMLMSLEHVVLVWMFVGLLTLLSVFSGYLGLITMTQAHYKSLKVPGPLAAYFEGLKLVLSGGFFPLSLALIVVAFGYVSMATMQLAGLILTFISFLGLMIPVLYVIEKRGGIDAISRSYFLKYAVPAQIGRFGVFFQLVVLGMVFYCLFDFWPWLNQLILDIDILLDIDRSLWASFLGSSPFTFPYLVALIVSSLMQVLTIAAFAIYSTTFYFAVTQK